MTDWSLNQNVLVLNRHWSAVHVTNVRRALVLLFADHAHVVTEDFSTHDFESWRDLSQAMERARKITTPSFQIALPDVIMLTRFGKCPPRQVKFSRRNIYVRDGQMCQYCGCFPPKDEITIDHVVPRSRGGRSTWENVVLACVKCNTRKGSRLLHEVGMKLLTEPCKPHWLACTQYHMRSDTSQFWQKFIDNAYWNVPLKE